MAEITSIKVESCEGWEGCRRERLLVNGIEMMSAAPLSECPEDAILERDLLGPSDFVDLLQSIITEHNGKRIKFEYEEVEEF